MSDPAVYCDVVWADRPPSERPLLPFGDLVPWADPYIAALVEKVQRSGWPLLAGGSSAPGGPDDLYFGEDVLGGAY